MDGLGRTPIPGQKLLRGKIVKTCHDRQYKRGLSHAQEKQQPRGGGRRNKREYREKEAKKGVKDRTENLENKKELERKIERVSKSVIVGMHQ